MVYSYKDLKKAKISGASDAIPEVKKKTCKVYSTSKTIKNKYTSREQEE